jgi:hypothetical protein
MFSGTAQVFHYFCQFFFCLFCESSCPCKCGILTFSHNQNLNSVQKNCLFSVSQSSGNDLYASMKAKCHLSFNHFGRLRAFWDDAIVVSAGELRKLWDSQSELSSSLCKRGLETQSWDLRYCLSKLRSLLSLSVRYNVTQYNRSLCKCMDPYRENIFANQKQNSVLPLVLLCPVLRCAVSKTSNSSSILQ